MKQKTFPWIPATPVECFQYDWARIDIRRSLQVRAEGKNLLASDLDSRAARLLAWYEERYEKKGGAV